MAFKAAAELLGIADQAAKRAIGGEACSLPIPVVHDGKLLVAVFYHQVSARPGQNQDWPPRKLVIVDAETGAVVSARSVAPHEVGPDAPLDRPLPGPRHDPPPVIADFWRGIDRIKEISPAVWEAFHAGSTQVAPATKALLDEYRALFRLVAVKPLVPYYLAIGAPFYTWLDDVLR
jgi:hypothetical protein